MRRILTAGCWRGNFDAPPQPTRQQSVLGGLPAIKALAQEFGLWAKLRALRLLDPRTRWGSGLGPDAIVEQLLYSFVAGGASLLTRSGWRRIHWRGGAGGGTWVGQPGWALLARRARRLGVRELT